MAPLVVLAGWLGCQPKSMRRYEELYRTIGIRSLVRIAPPHVVVRQVFALPLEPIVAPTASEFLSGTADADAGAGADTTVAARDESVTMQKMAWDILQDVHTDGCSSFYVHAFSNGGCFLWEQIRRILLEEHKPLQRNQQETHPQRHNRLSLQTETVDNALRSLRKKLKGVIFDSCPVVNMNRLDIALEHCTESEREEVTRRYGSDVESLVTGRDVCTRNVAQRRIDAYSTGLRDDPLLIPQLYIYSRDDPLTPSQYIDELVAYRRTMAGKNQTVVLRRVWDESLHCSHLLRHPQDYSDAVRSLVEVGERKGDSLAKL